MDGLVFIDESYLSELNDDLLYEMDILLDLSGTSELICDFPNEDWDIVRQRETDKVGSSFKRRETVACEKPDSSAICLIVTIILPAFTAYL